MAQTQSELSCVHQHYLTNDIHKLVIQNASKQAVDHALMHLDNILDAHPIEDTLLILIDARIGVPPLQYFFTSLRALYSKREHLPPIRAAYIYNDSVVLSVLQMFFNALGLNASRKFIKGGSEIEAQKWLLSDAQS